MTSDSGSEGGVADVLAVLAVAGALLVSVLGCRAIVLVVAGVVVRVSVGVIMDGTVLSGSEAVPVDAAPGVVVMELMGAMVAVSGVLVLLLMAAGTDWVPAVVVVGVMLGGVVAVGVLEVVPPVAGAEVIGGDLAGVLVVELGVSVIVDMPPEVSTAVGVLVVVLAAAGKLVGGPADAGALAEESVLAVARVMLEVMADA
jgi:hypothetical protein